MISDFRRLRFSWSNFSFWSRAANWRRISSSSLEIFPSSSFHSSSSDCFVSIKLSSSFSSWSELFSSWTIRSWSCLISITWRLISAWSLLICAYPLRISSAFFSCCLIFILAVFCSIYFCRSSSWNPAMVSRSVFLWFLFSSMDFCISTRFCFNWSVFVSSSSISRRLPSRLLLFLKVPPVIEPPGLKDSPSVVTILRLCLYFFPIAIAWSMLSTTSTLPRRNFVICWYWGGTDTSSLAIPTTPGSFSASFDVNSPRGLILLIGRKVARP